MKLLGLACGEAAEPWGVQRELLWCSLKGKWLWFVNFEAESAVSASSWADSLLRKEGAA